MTNKINVVIPDFSNTDWTAGSVYLNNLKSAVDEFISDIDLSILKISSKEAKPSIIAPLLKILKEILNKIRGYDYDVQTEIENNFNDKIDCIYMPGFKPLRINAPIVSWIPDFQHLHLKSMFSKFEILARNYTTKLAAKKATIIVLSSYDAEKDFHNLLPEFKLKTRVMQFVADIPETIYDSEPNEVLKIYNLPEKFFYLPNQFWMHKNHLIIWDALRILKERNKKVFVVCTGNTNDYRNRNYYNELIKKISDFGIDDQIKIIGLVPHEHVLQLIRQSVAVINPSLFEGWSTTVEETKSIGKRMILSNLNVHREQNPEGAIFFSPNNSKELADLISKTWENKYGPDLIMESKAKSNLTIRKSNFANTFYSIINEAMQ